jgi:hypothetical protein
LAVGSPPYGHHESEEQDPKKHPENPPQPMHSPKIVHIVEISFSQFNTLRSRNGNARSACCSRAPKHTSSFECSKRILPFPLTDRTLAECPSGKSLTGRYISFLSSEPETLIRADCSGAHLFTIAHPRSDDHLKTNFQARFQKFLARRGVANSGGLEHKRGFAQPRWATVSLSD